MSKKVEIEIDCSEIDYEYSGNEDCKLTKVYKFNLDKDILISDIIKERIAFYNKCIKEPFRHPFNINEIYLVDAEGQLIPIDIKLEQTSGPYKLLKGLNNNDIKLINLIKYSISNLLELSMKLSNEFTVLSNNIYTNINLTTKHPLKEINFIIEDNIGQKIEQKHLNNITIQDLIKDYIDKKYANGESVSKKTPALYLNNIQIPFNLTLAQASITNGTILQMKERSTTSIEIIENLNYQIIDRKIKTNRYIKFLL